MPDTLITLSNQILRVQLNRPRKKNALTPAMYDSLREAIERANSDPDIRVITLTGSGDSFCAGNDLNTFLADPGSDAAARFIMAIAGAQTPIVAAVNGVAVGVGVTMLLHCDLVYAAADAKFNFAFIDLRSAAGSGLKLFAAAHAGIQWRGRAADAGRGFQRGEGAGMRHRQSGGRG